MSGVTLLLQKTDGGLLLFGLLQVTAFGAWAFQAWRPSGAVRTLGLLSLGGALALGVALLAIGGLEAGSLLSASAAVPLLAVAVGLSALALPILLRGGPARLGVLTSLLAFALLVGAVPRAQVELIRSFLPLATFLRAAGFAELLLAGLLTLEGMRSEGSVDFALGSLRALRAAFLLMGAGLGVRLFALVELRGALRELALDLLLLALLAALLHLHHVKAWRDKALRWGTLVIAGLVGLLCFLSGWF